LPTNTPTPTPTPTGAYIVLSPIKDEWPEETLPNGVIELHNHLPDGQYNIFWTDNCGVRTDLGLVLDSFLGAVAADVPEPVEIAPDFRYLCPPVQGGRSYTGTLSTSLASLDVRVRVPVQPPDLVVPRVILPASAVASDTITVSVQVANAGRGMVSDRFAVDIYVDPDPAPVVKGQAGQGTLGDGSPTQWYSEVITPGTSVILNYVITVPPTGSFSFWAQVDTSDRVEELDEDNNILGPVWFGSPLDELPVTVRREELPGDAPQDGEAGEVAEPRTDERGFIVWQAEEPPAPDPAKAYEVTGRALVVLDGVAAPIGGVDVRAVRLSEGSAATKEPERHWTLSASDATYHLYNLSPGQYRVYAEVWVSGRLYSASTTIDVKPGEVWTDVDLYLL
jgi:hypothetical protein